jgi:phosphate transport system permease protein
MLNSTANSPADASGILEIRSIPAARRRRDQLFKWLCLSSIIFAALILVLIFGRVVVDGIDSISWQFLTKNSSVNARKAGIFTALTGSLWIVVLTAIIAVPIGIAAAIYLEEFQRRKNWITNFIQLNIANLSGVPSIVYGLLGVGLFVTFANLGRSIISGALTMSLLVLPTIILVTQEALRAVPNSYRDGSLALGATRWQTIRTQVLPAAVSSIYTGIILSLSRAIGETAPLITIGAAVYLTYSPKSINDNFTVLPIQIYDWVQDPKVSFQRHGAGAILVLMVVLLLLNSVAIFLRSRANIKK